MGITAPLEALLTSARDRFTVGDRGQGSGLKALRGVLILVCGCSAPRSRAVIKRDHMKTHRVLPNARDKGLGAHSGF